jgi:hypothetical protein
MYYLGLVADLNFVYVRFRNLYRWTVVGVFTRTNLLMAYTKDVINFSNSSLYSGKHKGPLLIIQARRSIDSQSMKFWRLFFLIYH